VTRLIDQRCWNHGEREAVVRCPECRRFYCRECVTEHNGRMMCAACVAAAGRGQARGKTGVAVWIGLAAGGLLLAWLFFYNLGLILSRIPADFHGGSS
jgi:hypothetical protein